MNAFKVILTVALIGVLFGAGSAVAFPGMFYYSGKLTDSGGNPIDGTVSITFRLYNVAMGESASWTEMHGSVDVDNGSYTVMLGSITPNLDLEFDGSDKWLGITVGFDSEMTPRQKVGSVPYAMNADRLDGKHASEFGDGHSLDAADGSPVDALYVDNDGNIGIGTTNPLWKVHVNGNIHVQDGRRFCFIHQNPHWAIGRNINALGGSGDDLQIQAYGSSGDSFQIISLHGVYPFTFACRLQINLEDGNVGIGTTSPSHPLHMGSGAHCTAGGVWTNASSRKYKENINELTSEEAVEALEGLNPVTFNYKVDKDEQYLGFIAEEVPELVSTKDREGMSPMDVVAVLTKVVQEQQKTIDELKKDITDLKKEVE